MTTFPQEIAKQERIKTEETGRGNGRQDKTNRKQGRVSENGGQDSRTERIKQTKPIDLWKSLFPVNNLKGKCKSVSLKKNVDTPRPLTLMALRREEGQGDGVGEERERRTE